MCKKVPASVAILNGAKYLAYDYARFFASLRMTERHFLLRHKKETPSKGCLCNTYTIARRFSAASSASARCSQNIEAAGTPSPILLPQAAALQKPNGLFADRLRP